jgi:type VI secretion system secreted protein VgrG
MLRDHDRIKPFAALEPNSSIECAGGPLGTRPPGVTGVMFSMRIPSGGVVQRDWDWPSDPSQVREREAMSRVAPGDLLVALGELESFPSRRAGVEASGLRVQDEYEALACRDRVLRCDSDVLGVAPGRWFDLEFGADEPSRMLVVGVRHVGAAPDADPVASSSDDPPERGYSNGFECLPADTEYRPERVSERPRIQGLHTAVVVGPTNEEIHTDEHGRIRVRMHWDRAKNPDADASCWLRVAQSWAGQGWGGVFIPRVGMEVLVAFLDGDPDRPVCVGAVYNGSHRPPYDLPDERTKSTIRTQSSPGGNGYNELTFEDAAGREEVYVRAQRNLRTQVLANESRSVGHDQSVEIGHDQTLAIGGDQHTTIKGNQTLTVEGGGTEGLAGTAVEVKGAVEIKVTEPGTVQIEAAERIVLCVGKSSITIDGDRITLCSGLGTTQTLDETALLLPQKGSMLRLSGSVQLSAAPGSPLEVFSERTKLSSAAGSYVVLTDNISMGAELGARMLLTADAELDAARITATAGQGARLALDANAAVTGSEVSCTGGGGSMTVGPSGAALDGTTVDVSAAAVASLVAPMVKIN